MDMFDWGGGDWLAGERMGLAARDPRAQVRPAPVREMVPLRLQESQWVPDGAMFVEDGVVWLARFDRYGDRTGVAAFMRAPLFTRCTVGGREAARDRRRHRPGWHR